MKIQCPHCNTVQNAPAQSCIKCGVQFVVQPIRLKANQNVIAAVLGILLLGFFVLRWLSGSTQEELQTASSNTNIVSENIAATNQLKRDLAEGFNTTTWYRNIKNVSIKNNTVEIRTDLISKDEKAEKICGGVSFHVYSYNGTTQNEIILIYNNKDTLLIKRNGIADKCE